jgi:hypothetical protein
MSDAEPAKLLILQLVLIGKKLDALNSPIASAYVHSAIDSLCREYNIPRERFNSDPIE